MNPRKREMTLTLWNKTIYSCSKTFDLNNIKGWMDSKCDSCFVWNIIQWI